LLGERAFRPFLSILSLSTRIIIIRITGVTYERTRSHADRLCDKGTHAWDGKVLRELEPFQTTLRDRIFKSSPRTSQPSKFLLPFNYPLGDQRTVRYGSRELQ
jgi:hypothetical protein